MESILKVLGAIYWFAFENRILFSVLFFVLPVVYCFMKKIPSISKYITLKSVIYSTLLGASFGVGVCSFLNLLACSLGNYPIKSTVYAGAFAMSVCLFFPAIYLYWIERSKNGAKWWIVDTFYSLVIFFATSGLFTIVYIFAEKHFSGIW